LREREMLEAAGVANALAAERSAHGEFVSAVFAEPEPAVTTAIERLGPPAQSIFDAGRSREPGQRVKRLCALIYAQRPNKHAPSAPGARFGGSTCIPFPRRQSRFAPNKTARQRR